MINAFISIGSFGNAYLPRTAVLASLAAGAGSDQEVVVAQERRVPVQKDDVSSA